MERSGRGRERRVGPQLGSMDPPVYMYTASPCLPSSASFHSTGVSSLSLSRNPDGASESAVSPSVCAGAATKTHLSSIKTHINADQL